MEWYIYFVEKKSKIISPEEKKTIAFHEAGHATVSWMLEHASPLVKVTIVPRGRSLGAAWYLPEERQIVRTEQMLDEMCATLGGRAAEIVLYDNKKKLNLNDNYEIVVDSNYSKMRFWSTNFIIKEFITILNK